MARTVIALAFVVGLGGCILLVDAEAGGASCQFAATDGVCGACVRESCQELVDSCCGNAECERLLGALDRCSLKVSAGCEEIAAAVDQESTFGKVASCISRRCSTECPGVQPRGRTRCRSTLFGGTETCECEPSSQPNSFDCSKAAFPETLCCAPESWPAAGQRCSCQRFACSPSSSASADCFCTLGSVSESSSCSGTFCCADSDVCTCGPRPCEDFEVQVPSCERSIVRCKAGEREVESCAVFD